MEFEVEDMMSLESKKETLFDNYVWVLPWRYTTSGEWFISQDTWLENKHRRLAVYEVKTKTLAEHSLIIKKTDGSDI